ncbi:MAG: DNA polymerase III subunit beta [bacterium]
MRLSCTQENLHQGLSLVCHLPTKNVNLPILHNILIRAQEKVFVLSATNLEIAITATIRGKVDEPGEFTIPGKLFSDYTTLLPTERVDLSLTGQSLEIRCGTYSTKIRGVPATEFPLVPSVELKHEFHVEVDDLRGALAQTLFAVASHESRPELCGIYFLFSGSTLTFAATDSFRLAEKVIPLLEPAAEEVKCIMPSRTAAEVFRILGIMREDLEAGSKVSIGLSDNQIVVRIGGTELVSRAIEGNYPEYKVIIPTVTRTEVVISKELLLPAIKNASLFSRSGLCDVTLSVGQNSITLSSNDQQTGENSVTLEAEVQGDLNTLTVNHRYLLDGIQSVSGDKVRLKIIDGGNPMVVAPEGETGHLYIVMPIRQ